MIFFILFLINLSVPANAQPGEGVVRDTHSVNVLNRTAAEIYESQPQKTLEFAMAALAASEQMNYPEGKAEAYLNLGLFCIRIGKLDSSIAYLTRGETVAAELRRDDLLGKIYHTRGIVKYHQGKPEGAIADMKAALDSYRRTQNRKQISAQLSHLATTYVRLNMKADALPYFREACQLDSVLGDTAAFAANLVECALIYQWQGNHGAAETTLQRAEKIAPGVKDPTARATIFMALGAAMNEGGNWTEAVKRFELAVKAFEAAADKEGKARALGGLANAWEQAADTLKAIQYYEQAFPLLNELKLPPPAEWSSKLSRLYVGKRKFDKALPLLRESIRAGVTQPDRTQNAKDIYLISFVFEKLDRPKDALKYMRWYAALQDTLLRSEMSRLNENGSLWETQARNLRGDLDSSEKSLREELELLEHSSGNTFMQVYLIAGAAVLVMFVLLVFSILNANKLRRKVRTAEQAARNQDQRVAKLLELLDKEVPPALGQFGLAGALQELGAKLRKESGLKIKVEEQVEIPRLQQADEFNLYRIAEELMANAITHAGARSITLTLNRVNNKLELTVADDGNGKLDSLLVETHPGSGWLLIMARLEKLKAAFEIDAHPGAGSKVVVTLQIRM